MRRHVHAIVLPVSHTRIHGGVFVITGTLLLFVRIPVALSTGICARANADQVRSSYLTTAVVRAPRPRQTPRFAVILEVITPISIVVARVRRATRSAGLPGAC